MNGGDNMNAYERFLEAEKEHGEAYTLLQEKRLNLNNGLKSSVSKIIKRLGGKGYHFSTIHDNDTFMMVEFTISEVHMNTKPETARLSLKKMEKIDEIAENLRKLFNVSDRDIRTKFVGTIAIRISPLLLEFSKLAQYAEYTPDQLELWLEMKE